MYHRRLFIVILYATAYSVLPSIAGGLGFSINIFSNGTLLDSEKIIRIAKCNIRSYQTSIYGATAQIHDKITGVNGSFDKTIQVLDTFSKLGIATCIKTTMMNTNIQDYNDLIKLSKILKSDIQVGLSIMPTMLRNSTNSKYRLDENNLLKINIAEMKRFGETNIEKLPIESNGICNAGFSNLTINPYGDIILCSGMHVVFGNALKDDISRIWKSSPKLEEWQCKTLSDIECMKDCQYAEYCSFCPAQAYLETGNCFKKYEEACLIAKTQFKTEEVLKYELQNAK